MTMEDLPSEYDVIVVGTGMTGSIVAAALSRVGKAVLHIDENEYYGEEWASFNLETINSWLNPPPIQSKTTTQDVSQLLQPLETFVDVFRNPRCSEVKQEWFCPEKAVAKAPADGEAVLDDKETTRDPVEDILTQEKLLAQHRKFNLDLSPKMLYSRGPLVELLISSNIARYAEFKSVGRVLTWREARLEAVPCSRADVFATRHVSVVQKRMLVKILTLFAEYPASAADFTGFEQKTFVEYLKHKKLDKQLVHYIVYAIAMGNDTTPCLEGVASCQRFLQSLGRYGNTPFLCPLYGSGELPQCFCRMCAVFGGVYHLKRAVDGFVLSEGGEVEAVVSAGQRLKTKHVVVTSSLCPGQFVQSEAAPQISRAIFITDRSLLEAEKESITLLQFPPERSGSSPVTVMEIGGSCHVCPPGLFVVHMTSEGGEDDPFGHVRAALFRQLKAQKDENPIEAEVSESHSKAQEDNSVAPTEDSENAVNEDSRPSVLWSLSWRLASGCLAITPACPPNLEVTSGPDSGLDFDGSVAQAKEIFLALCPDEEFLPRAPDPDEIVLEGFEAEETQTTSGNDASENGSHPNQDTNQDHVLTNETSSDLPNEKELEELSGKDTSSADCHQVEEEDVDIKQNTSLTERAAVITETDG